MTVDRARLYDSASDFFSLRGSVSMRLEARAAIDVCRMAADRGLVVSRIEGGVWRHPGFESRLDCIWDGRDPPLSIDSARENNEEAALFVNGKAESECNVFILTAPSVLGWSEL